MVPVRRRVACASRGRAKRPELLLLQTWPPPRFSGTLGTQRRRATPLAGKETSVEHDLSAWYAEVSKALHSKTSLADSMETLLAYCNKQHRWQGWGRIGELDFDSDVAELEKWVTGVLKKEPPPSSVKAFWFGIFNPVYDGETSCDTYIAGASAFDPDDESFEWACNPDYFPDGRYAHSTILEEIYQTVNGSPASAMGEYVLCLAYTAFAVRELARRVDKTMWLGKSKERGLAVGFDSGDGLLLEPLSRSAC